MATLLATMSVRKTPDVLPLDAPPTARYSPVICVTKGADIRADITFERCSMGWVAEAKVYTNESKSPAHDLLVSPCPPSLLPKSRPRTEVVAQGVLVQAFPESSHESKERQ